MITKQRIAESELIINPDGSVYHLHLKPGDIAETIITVGDQNRVEEVSCHFDKIDLKMQYREFLTHTGYMNNKRITVLSTGIGTDNLDIVLNELDALVNIDFETRTIKDNLTSLDIVRMGTSGCVSEEHALDSTLISEIGIGMDGVMHFYEFENNIQETVYLEAFASHIKPHFNKLNPYLVGGSEKLLDKLGKKYPKGTTITACGFYAPQGRSLRTKNAFPNFVEVLNSFRHKHFRITNFEMETATMYGFGRMLGHHCLSINTLVADRINKKFSSNPRKAVQKMIAESLEILTS